MPNLPKHYDTIIIGAGVVGCAAARFLSRYRLNVLVIEAEDDIACGATKANSGIVHAGYDCEPGTLKAELNLKGSVMYQTLAEELDIPFKVNGSLVLCYQKEDHNKLEELYQRSIENKIPGTKLLTAEEVYKLEHNLVPGLYSALLAQGAGIISPYEAAIAFAENASDNGVEFLLGTRVVKVEAGERPFIVETANTIRTVNTTRTVNTSSLTTFTADTIINAAGVMSDTIHNFAAETADLYTESILTQRGQYYLLDNAYKGFVSHTLFPLPSPKGKGVLIAPTVDGNIIVGPNAEDFVPKNDNQTTKAGLDEILKSAEAIVKDLPLSGRITSFAGIRAKHSSKDFVINEPCPGFINALGIDSPGLSAAPAIGKKLAGMVAKLKNPEEDPNFNPRRIGLKHFSSMSFDEKAALIKKDPKYGHIVCRCETVTEAEIIAAIRRPVGARNLAAIKRRTRAQMGRCQGGFCSLKLTEILAAELNISEESIWTS